MQIKAVKVLVHAILSQSSILSFQDFLEILFLIGRQLQKSNVNMAMQKNI